MALVIDVSAVAALAHSDEDATYAQAVIDAALSRYAVVPTLFWFEVRNVLVMNERRNRLSSAQTANFLADLSALRIDVDDKPDQTMVLNLARQHRLTVYDAAYLELAQRRGLPLATLDRELKVAAPAAGLLVWTTLARNYLATVCPRPGAMGVAEQRPAKIMEIISIPNVSTSSPQRATGAGRHRNVPAHLGQRR